MEAIKDILIIAHFTQVPGENGNGRFRYIAQMLDKQDAAVEVVTTTFSHRTKCQRTQAPGDPGYRLTMLREPGYRKNVSLQRIYSHYVLGRSLKHYLKHRKKPDVIYCAVPSLDAAGAALRYAKKHRVPFFIDIQDLWPEAFQMVFPIPLLSGMLFWPMRKKADSIYGAADAIFAVSQTYADRALSVSKKCKEATVVFLGTDLARFDQIKKASKAKIPKPADEIWMAYIGTLGHSYDLAVVLDAMALLEKEEKEKNLRFFVMGDGPLRGTFETHAKELGLAVTFAGMLPYEEMVRQLCVCDMAVNPITPGSTGSIINKVGDYAAAGLPVLNTQECPEYRKLLEQYQCGVNCPCGDPRYLAEQIGCMCRDDERRQTMGRNSRKLAEDLFDRGKTYGEILNRIGPEYPARMNA